ncbi:hypothetical protein FRC03_004838 [Tulasnella sp. 419]|nr:hypothetical protein FRC03_004838 [Tulasnella sp. 419]
MVTTRAMRLKRNLSSGDDDGSEVHNAEGRPGKRQKREGGKYSSLSTTSKGENGASDAATNESNLAVTTPKAIRKRQGRLAGMMNMPIDIFEEICSLLHPLDLLHLAWTTKTLRCVVMSKTSKAAWRIARQSQEPDMPDCPEFLTEPQYAALVFTTICQVCGNPKATRVYYGLYSRYCKRCVSSHVIEINDALLSSLRMSHLDRIKLVKMLPTVRAYKTGEGRWSTPTWCSKKTMTKLSKEWLKLENEADRAAFIESRSPMVVAIQEHARALKQWHSQESYKKNRAIEDVRKSRSESIKDRLLELGWETKDFPARVHSPKDREWFTLTKKNQPLTEKVWINVQPKLEKFLAEYQPRRLERERQERVDSRTRVLKQFYVNFRLQQSKLSPNILFPGGYPQQLGDIPVIQDLIDDDEHGPITKERWEDKIPEIIEFLTQRTSEIESVVATWYAASYKQWRESNSGPPRLLNYEFHILDSEGHLDLRRATVVFKCSRCQEPTWYPACFQHRDCCQWREWSKVTTTTWKPGSPGPLGLTFDPTLNLTVMQLFAQLDIDPLTTSSLDLPPFLNPLSPAWERRESYACLLCDEDNQFYNTIPRLIEHLRKEIADFQVREAAIARLGRKAFSNLKEGQDIPVLRDGHDLSVKRDLHQINPIVTCHAPRSLVNHVYLYKHGIGVSIANVAIDTCICTQLDFRPYISSGKSEGGLTGPIIVI